MKAVILAGGLGTRISEESHLRPKPMIEIGEKPILWHIMKIYAAHGINEFIICAGYKAYAIKDYFRNYFLQTADVKIDIRKNKIEFYNRESEPWVVTIIDTGLDTMTGGRLLRVKKFIGKETFCLTYGDGVADVDISSLIKFHKKHGKLCSMTAVQPPARFGALVFDGEEVKSFDEKPKDNKLWINGGFFVLEPGIFKYLKDDATVWERQPLRGLAKARQLMPYRHHGFWAPMDTLRDKNHLEELWSKDKAPWRVWA